MAGLYYNGSIKNINFKSFFDTYNVTEEDLKYYNELINSGREQEAVDEFIVKYVTDPSRLYSDNIQSYMSKAEQGEMKPKVKNKMERYITLTSLSLTGILVKNVKAFITKVFAPKIFKDNNITDLKLKKIILDATLKEFELLTTGAMANTQVNILANIRKMQRNMIFFNQNISKVKDLTPAFFDQQVDLFRRQLRRDLPQYYRAMEDGNILISRSFGPDGQSVRFYKLDYYTRMSTETTLLNVDRTSVIESVKFEEGFEGALVVEYYLRDRSGYKTNKRREICKTILKTLLFGKPLLALNKETGLLLGIRTVEEVKATPDFALGVGCHHSVKVADKITKKKVLSLLKQRKREVA